MYSQFNIIDCVYFFFFFFNDTATTEIYTLSLHDALPISDSTASSNQIALPHDLCIGRPVSSVTRSYVSTRSYCARPSSTKLMKSIEENPSRICTRDSLIQAAGNHFSQCSWFGRSAPLRPSPEPVA